VYVKKQYEEENQTASMIARCLLDQGEAYDIEKELAQAQTALAITLSEKQKQAVRMVFQNQISIITGGPGTGKTTVLKVILYIHAIVCRSQVQLMAPTGRAARRMAAGTGEEGASKVDVARGLRGAV